MLNELAAAPASWWRPPLDIIRLLDAVASDAQPPVGLVLATPEHLVPALLRLRSATCFTLDPWSLPAQALLPVVGQFAGAPPVVEPLAGAPRAAFQTILWFDPQLSSLATDIRRVCASLAAHGRLVVIVTPTPVPLGALSVIRLRHALRRANLRIGLSNGYLGPRALAWSAVARLAFTAGLLDHYDRCHAAMRAAYAEGWPLTLLCRSVVTVSASHGGIDE